MRVSLFLLPEYSSPSSFMFGSVFTSTSPCSFFTSTLFSSSDKKSESASSFFSRLTGVVAVSFEFSLNEKSNHALTQSLHFLKCGETPSIHSLLLYRKILRRKNRFYGTSILLVKECHAPLRFCCRN